MKRGKTLLPINAVAWAVAASGLGFGAFFILTSASASSSSKTTPTVDAMIAPTGGSLRVRF